MPIANCIITRGTVGRPDELVNRWSAESGVPDQHMTVNVIRSEQQLGNPYAVMADLQLPSVWSDEKLSSLQTGLARALSVCFDVPIDQVHLVTHIIRSGMVVENDREVSW